MLNRGGWYLLDDTRTALLSADHTVTDRPSHGAQPYQDGYFFGYGTDYSYFVPRYDTDPLTGNRIEVAADRAPEAVTS